MYRNIYLKLHQKLNTKDSTIKDSVSLFITYGRTGKKRKINLQKTKGSL